MIYISLPIFERPSWCINDDSIPTSGHGYWYCETFEKNIPNSQLPKLPIRVPPVTYICCLLILMMFTRLETKFMQYTEQEKKFCRYQCWIVGVSITDYILTIFWYSLPDDSSEHWWSTELAILEAVLSYNRLAAFLRPVLMIVMIRSFRIFLHRYVQVMKAAAPMTVFILIYVGFFSWMGGRLFQGTIEGVSTFSTPSDAYYFMFVCLTTSNFPDVMLPAYQMNRISCVFFIFFISVGLFLLLNLLLAVFYANY